MDRAWWSATSRRPLHRPASASHRGGRGATYVVVRLRSRRAVVRGIGSRGTPLESQWSWAASPAFRIRRFDSPTKPYVRGDGFGSSSAAIGRGRERLERLATVRWIVVTMVSAASAARSVGIACSALALRALTLREEGTDLRACRQGIVGTGASHSEGPGSVGQREGLVELATAGQFAGQDARERIPRPDGLDDRHWPGGKVAYAVLVEGDRAASAERHDDGRNAEQPLQRFGRDHRRRYVGDR